MLDSVKYPGFLVRSRERFAFDQDQLLVLMKYRDGLRVLIEKDPTRNTPLIKNEISNVTECIIKNLD
jgi:hypothetical protein